MTPQDPLHPTAAMIFGADRVLAWGPSAAWLDAGRPLSVVHHVLARPLAFITAFMEPG